MGGQEEGVMVGEEERREGGWMGGWGEGERNQGRSEGERKEGGNEVDYSIIPPTLCTVSNRENTVHCSLRNVHDNKICLQALHTLVCFPL